MNHDFILYTAFMTTSLHGNVPAFLTLCEENPSTTSGLPHKGPIMCSLDDIFVVRLKTSRVAGGFRRHGER